MHSAEVSHVVDSHHGIFSAQIFCQRFGSSQARWPERETWIATWPDAGRQRAAQEGDRLWASVLAGPDGEYYAESWCDILDNAVIMIDGERFFIHESEGIYLVRDGVEWCDICDWFYSKDCECPHGCTDRRRKGA